MPHVGVEELWRRACVPASALERLADAALPLFVAADRGHAPQPELVEPPVALARMADGGEVVEDYRSVGLSLRRHPVASRDCSWTFG
jgi:error-prone DNA polymerase